MVGNEGTLVWKTKFTVVPNKDVTFIFGPDSEAVPGVSLTRFADYNQSVCLNDRTDQTAAHDFGTFVCSRCIVYIHPKDKKKKPERPPLSVAFRDFGQLFRPCGQICAPSLPPLTFLERLALAPARTYMQMLKISGAWVSKGFAPFFRGHSITFRAPTTLPRVLNAIMTIPRTDVHSFVCLEFVGPKGQWDRQLSSLLPFGPILQARFDILMAYARCLHGVGYYERLFDKFGCVLVDDETTPKAYFTDDRHTKGSLEWILYQGVHIEEDQNIIDLDAFARRNDPSGALPQAADPGEKAPEFEGGVPIVYEEIHLDSDGSDPSLNPNKDYLRDCLDVFKSVTPVEPGSNVPVRVPAPRYSTPMNSFTEFDVSVAACYPDLFPLGQGPGRGGPLTLSESRHLFLQFSSLHGKSAHLHADVFSKDQIAGGARGLKTAVRYNSKSFAAFRKMHEDPATTGKFDRAMENPECAESVVFIRELNRIFKSFSGIVPNSAGSRNRKKADFFASERFFGHSTFFNTVADDPVGSPSALRACTGSHNNFSFPAVDGGWAQSLREKHSFTYQITDLGPPMTIPTDYTSLLTRILGDPASEGERYRLDTLAMFEHIYGRKLNALRSTPRDLQAKGAYGQCSVCKSCTETNGKGMQHNHCCLTGGVPSWALRAAMTIDNPDIQLALATYLERCTTSELDPAIHIQSILRRLLNFPTFRASWAVTPSPADTVAYNLFTSFDTERTGVHYKHGSRCHAKGSKKDIRCSLSMPQSLSDTTTPMHIRYSEQDPADRRTTPEDLLSFQRANLNFTRNPCERDLRLIELDNKRPSIPADKVSSFFEPVIQGTPVTLNFENLSDVDVKAAFETLEKLRAEFLQSPDSGLDPRPLMQALRELKRGCETGQKVSKDSLRVVIESLPQEYQEHLLAAIEIRNGKVVSFTRILKALKKCNMACYFLSSGVAALVSCYYTIEYMTKDPTKRESTVATVASARRDEHRYGSVAPDAGEDLRTATYILHRSMNQWHNKTENSVPYVSSCNLKADPSPCTFRAQSFPMCVALKWVLAHTAPENLVKDFDGGGPEGDDADGVDEDDDVDDVDNGSDDDSGNEDDTIHILNSQSKVPLRRRHESSSTSGPPVLNPVLSTDGECVLFCIFIAYLDRHPLFVYYSFMEFFCVCVGVKCGAKDTPPPDDKKYKGTNARFAFTVGEYVDKMEIKIRSLFVVPKHFPSPPPAPTSLSPRAWRKAAHKFAVYVLVCHRPFSRNDLPALNWKAFLDFSEMCKNPPPNAPVGRYIGQVRMLWMLNLAEPLAPTDTDKQDHMTDRTRSATRWEDPSIDPESYFAGNDHYGAGGAPDTVDMTEWSEEKRAQVEAEFNLHVGLGDDQPNAHTVKEALYQSSLVDTLSGLFAQTDKRRPSPVVLSRPTQVLEISEAILREKLKIINDKDDDGPLRTIPTKVSDSVKERGLWARTIVRLKLGGDTEGRKVISELLRDFTCEPEFDRYQQEVVDIGILVIQEMSVWIDGGRQDEPPKQRLIYVQGGPGTGKSHVLTALVRYARALKKTLVICAPQGSAANRIGGQTVHYCAHQGGLGSSVYRPTGHNVMELKKRNSYETMVLNVEDEVSTTPPPLFVNFERAMAYMAPVQFRLRPFGGFSCILFGDFFQLPPVPARTLLDCLIGLYVFKNNLSEADRAAAELFFKFETITLLINHRAKDDPKWARVVKNMRSTKPGSYPVREFLIPLLEDGSLILTPEDVTRNPQWGLTDVRVSNNMQTHTVAMVRGQARAKALGVPRIRWRRPLTGSLASCINGERLEELYKNPRMWDTFIAGDSAHLTDNQKVSRNISNGTPVRKHSLVLEPGHDEDLARIQQANPGEDIIIHQPLSQNVELINENPDHFTDITLVPNRAVIGLLQNKTMSFKTAILGTSKRLEVSCRHFGVDNGGASTIHKLQGECCNYFRCNITTLTLL